MAVSQMGGKWAFNGEREDHVLGESAFKLLCLASILPGDARRWVEDRQSLYNREKLVFRVFGETGSWGTVQPNDGMFGSPPRDPGFWDVDHLRKLAAENDRVRDLTPTNKSVLDWMFRASQESGCVFEYVCIATLKHTEGITVGIIDHCIRQTALYCRELQGKYPRANIIFSAMNESFAHNDVGATIADVNMWAKRFYRLKNPVSGNTKYGFSEGSGFLAEQWPEGFIIVDEGGRDTFSYSTGKHPGVFKAAMLHPERTPSDRKWWQVPDSLIRYMTDHAKGTPIGFTESMYYVDKDDTARAEKWYRNRNGWTNEIDQYIRFFEAAMRNVDYFIVHHEKGVQCDPLWPRPETRLESYIRERFQSGTPLPPAPVVPYQHVIEMAYLQILKRAPDDEGLQFYSNKMKAGMTEADMRESLIRNPEFRGKFGG